MTATVFSLLERLVKQRDVAAVKALVAKLITGRRPSASSPPATQLAFPWAQTDDATFVEVMLNFPERFAEAMRKKREREAAEEERRARARAARQKTSPEQAIAKLISRGSVKGRILHLVMSDASRVWTTREIVKAMGLSDDAVGVFCHDLVKAGLLIRVDRGVFRAIGKA